MMRKWYICLIIVLFVILIYFVSHMEKNSVTNKPSHHTEKGYRNPFPGFEERGFRDFLKWVLSGRNSSQQNNDRAVYPFETVENDGSFLRSNNTNFTVTWIGNSTVFIQLQGLNILTDPVWSKRASPLTWAGPKRYTEPGISFEDLPDVHVVLITHNHYDHLDRETIRRLGNEPLYLVPLGLGAFFKKLGISHFYELDWWETVSHRGIEFICTPSQHFSARGLFDRNETLWCSWSARSKKGSFFFCGDSGYFPGFKEIGDRYGSFDLACLPIGAYMPQWFMGPVHLSPKEAIQAFRDICGGKFLAVHWGTFSLADDPPELAPLTFLKELREQKFSRNDFWLLKHGETRIIELKEDTPVSEKKDN